MIQFVIRNLLSNANKFTQRGKIIIFSDQDEQYIKLTVNDTGMGMNEKVIDALLQKDTIISSLGNDNEKGSGIGFKLIQRIHGRLRREDPYHQYTSKKHIGYTLFSERKICCYFLDRDTASEKCIRYSDKYTDVSFV